MTGGTQTLRDDPIYEQRRADSPASARLLFLLLGLGIACAFVLSVALGSVSIPVDQVIRVVLGLEPSRATWTTIILDLRLPRTLIAMAVGAGLGASGLQMQTLFRNPLADPYILGVSSGAGLGVGLLTLASAPLQVDWVFEPSWLGGFTLVGAAAVGAAGVLAIMLFVAMRFRGVVIVLITGVMIGYFTSAATSLLLYLASPYAVQRFQSWSFGSFRMVGWSQMPVFGGAVLVGLVVGVVTIKQLNAFMLGENYARSLGIHVKRMRFIILASACLLSGTITAFCGPIAFLGIAAPQVARAIFRTSDHRVIVWGAMLVGALMSLGCGIMAELPGSSVQLPVNVATALVGAPIVISALMKVARTKGDL